MGMRWHVRLLAALGAVGGIMLTSLASFPRATDPPPSPVTPTPCEQVDMGPYNVHRYTGNCTWEVHADPDETPNESVAKSPTVCPYTLHRVLGGDGDEFDVVGVDPVDGVSADRTVKWCFHERAARGCRHCGFSCAWFPHHAHDPMSLNFPLLHSPVQVRAWLKNNLWIGKPVSKEFRRTVYNQGWSAEYVEDFEYVGCDPIVPELTFIFPYRSNQHLTQRNVGHYLHDVVFPFFRIISNYVNLTHPRPEPYRVVIGWSQSPTNYPRQILGYLGDLLVAPLIQSQLIFHKPDVCYKRAVFDCPAANKMGPIRPFQDWLVHKRLMRFVPLPPPRGDEKPRMLMLLRNENGSRFWSGWEEARRTAEQWFHVAVPLNPADPMSTVVTRMKDLLPLLQSSHVLIGMHGAELATMVFMPNRSIVVEILPVDIRYYDIWYAEQARTCGLRLIRWTTSKVEYRRFESQQINSKQKKRVQKMFTKWEEGNRAGLLPPYPARNVPSRFVGSNSSLHTLLALVRRMLTVTTPSPKQSEP